MEAIKSMDKQDWKDVGISAAFGAAFVAAVAVAAGAGAAGAGAGAGALGVNDPQSVSAPCDGAELVQSEDGTMVTPKLPAGCTLAPALK